MGANGTAEISSTARKSSGSSLLYHVLITPTEISHTMRGQIRHYTPTLKP